MSTQMTPDPRRALIVSVGSPGAHGIKPGSAIICRCDGDGNPSIDDLGRVTAWYEGNIYNAVNLTAFIERVRCAAGRMTTNYPTVALLSVPAQDITVLAEFDLEREIVTRIVRQAELNDLAGEDTSLLLAGPVSNGPITDPSAIGAAVSRAGSRLVGRSPLAWQAANGHVVLQIDGRTVVFHPEDPALRGVLHQHPEPVQRKLLGPAPCDVPPPAGENTDKIIRHAVSIAVTQLVADIALDADDDPELAGTWIVGLDLDRDLASEAERELATEAALTFFHDTLAIACLDDFEITAQILPAPLPGDAGDYLGILRQDALDRETERQKQLATDKDGAGA